MRAGGKAGEEGGRAVGCKYDIQYYITMLTGQYLYNLGGAL